MNPLDLHPLVCSWDFLGVYVIVVIPTDGGVRTGENYDHEKAEVEYWHYSARQY